MSRKPVEFDGHPMPYPGPIFRAHVRHVVDGDTLDALVDLGFNAYAYVVVRLRSIDTPEIYRPQDEEEREAGHRAKARVEALVMDRPVRLKTWKDKTTFGRYVADVEHYTDGEWRDLAGTLRAEGFAWGEDE